MFTLYWIALPANMKSYPVYKELSLLFVSYFFYFDIDCDVPTTHCRSSSGDSVNLLSRTINYVCSQNIEINIKVTIVRQMKN